MKYRLKIGEDTIDVSVTHSETDQDARINIGDKEYHVLYQNIVDNSLYLVVNGRATHAYISRGESGKEIFVNGRCFLVQDADHLNAYRSRRRMTDETPGEVTPPMPSVVVRILVQEGDQVEKGQGLVVVSAMKMETTLKAPSNGLVKKINTTVDSKVSPGDILVEIEE